jgi:hypothetical protein
MCHDNFAKNAFGKIGKTLLSNRRRASTSGVGLAMGLAVSIAIMPAPVAAQDATFACTVLLCALSTNPSWGAIPDCVGPMTQVLTSIAHGGSWPVCPQAPIVDSGSQPYACPAGAQNMSLAPAVASDVRGGTIVAPPSFVPNPNGPYCGTPAAPADVNPFDGSCASASINGVISFTVPAPAGGQSRPSCLTITDAAANPNPDYVDLAFPDPTTGAPTMRIWFNTNSYK